MAIKTKEQIKAYLNQCGDLDYGEFIDFIDSVLFEDGNLDIAPICQVTRYRRFKNSNAAITLSGLFDPDNNLVSVYVKRISSEPFNLNIGTTVGGSEIASQIIDDTLVSIDCTYLFSQAQPLYISGLSTANIADIVVVYNSFLCDDNGEISMTLLESIQERITALEDKLETTKDNLQEQINTLSQSLIQIPTGVIVQWNGSLTDIPSGWQRYNGNGSLFLIGESAAYPAGATGGEKEVKLSSDQQGSFKVSSQKELSSGNNMIKQINRLRFSGDSIVDIPDGGHNSWGQWSQDIKLSGAGSFHTNMPPYKSVIYIIKT